MKMNIRDWIAAVLLCSLVGCNSPSDDDPRILLDLKKKCVEAGEKARAALFEMSPPCDKELSEPRYTYNNDLKTCLYADKCFTVQADSRASLFIIDAFSNSVLIQYDMRTSGYSGSLPGLPAKPSRRDYFETKFHELFGPNAQLPRSLLER